MTAYLQYYLEKFGDEKSKVVFVASRLEEQALRWFEPTLKDFLANPDNNDADERKDFTNTVFKRYTTFAIELQKVFGDINEKLYI